MAGIFSGGEPGTGRRRRVDPDLREAARRQREQFASDIGDEHGRAWAHDPPQVRRRKSSRYSLIILAVTGLFIVLGAIPLLRGGTGGLLAADCATPAVAVDPDEVDPGERTGVQAAGPDQGRYVLAVDTETLTAAAGGGIDAGAGRVLGPTFTMGAGCRAPQVVFDAPTREGTHVVRLFRQVGTSYQLVAVTPLQVG